MWLCLWPFQCLVLRVQCHWHAGSSLSCSYLSVTRYSTGLINASNERAFIFFFIVLVTSKFSSSNHFTYHDHAPGPRHHLCACVYRYPCSSHPFLQTNRDEKMREGAGRGTWEDEGKIWSYLLLSGMLSGSRSRLWFKDDLCMRNFYSLNLWDLGPGFIPLSNSFKWYRES